MRRLLKRSASSVLPSYCTCVRVTTENGSVPNTNVIAKVTAKMDSSCPLIEKSKLLFNYDVIFNDNKEKDVQLYGVTTVVTCETHCPHGNGKFNS